MTHMEDLPVIQCVAKKVEARTLIGYYPGSFYRSKMILTSQITLQLCKFQQ